jgi:hypothetical protein
MNQFFTNFIHFNMDYFFNYILAYLSFKGSVPVIVSVKLGPLTRTPQRCSVAYLTDTV